MLKMNVMKLVFHGVMLYSSFLCALGQAKDDLTNLLIVNTFQETFTSSTDTIGAMTTRLAQALTGGQLTMSTKSVWLNVQRIANYVEQNLDTDFKKLNEIYLDWQVGNINHSELASRVSQLQITRNMQEQFTLYLEYQSIIKSDQYIAKSVGDDHILFVPKSIENVDQSLGLSVEKLPEYDFSFMPNLSILDYELALQTGKAWDIPTKEYQWLSAMRGIMGRAKYAAIHAEGGKLLNDAIAMIKPANLDVERTPFINIFLAGHGYDNAYISEISIVKRANQRQSDFQKLLTQFQNDFLMKSLTVASCYVGGAQNVKAFDISNQFSNQNLENITYPMIMQGSFALSTYGLHISNIFNKPKNQISLKDFQMFLEQQNYMQEYFQALNANPPDYVKAAQMGSPDDMFSMTNYVTNLVSIKMPHTSWFTPEVFDKKIQTITRVKALTSKEILIKKNVEMVLLSANNIDSIVVPNGVVIPRFMPVNYVNPNYVINSLIINAESATDDIHSVMRFLLPIPNVKEPIKGFIKEIRLGNKVYKDVYMFTYKKLTEDPIEYYKSGYTYTDDSGIMRMVVWPSAWLWPEEYKGPLLQEEVCSNQDAARFERDMRQVALRAEHGVIDITKLEQTIVAKKKSINEISAKKQNKKQVVENQGKNKFKKTLVSQKNEENKFYEIQKLEQPNNAIVREPATLIYDSAGE